MEYQEHFGKKFYLDRETGYWISTTCPKIRAHRWVYEYHYGPIEDSYHIHHIDGNKSNNDILNLKKVTEYEHFMLHLTEAKREWSRRWVEIIRPLTKEWHSSEEGRKWHVEHGIRCWANKQEVQKSCYCGNVYKTKTYHQAFCSNKCKSAHRRLIGLDNVQRICEKCGSTFMRSKYGKQKFCGRKCGSGRRKNKVD